MSQSPLSPIDRASRALRAFAADPVEFAIRIASEMREWPERGRVVRPYVPDADWDAELHACLGAALPCAIATELPPLWDRVLADMQGRGVTAGPMSYLGWNDGDPALIRAVWCLLRHREATRVVETGVAHGVTSRFVLEALARNGGGRLWSIDLAPQLHPEVHHEIGVAVPPALRGNWTLVVGSSRRRLAGVLREAGPIDLFIHDSKHTADNMLFELRLAWPRLRPGGAAIVDDIDNNDAFRRFCETVPHRHAWVCEAEPIRPDERRPNRKGYFGIIVKGDG